MPVLLRAISSTQEGFKVPAEANLEGRGGRISHLYTYQRHSQLTNFSRQAWSLSRRFAFTQLTGVTQSLTGQGMIGSDKNRKCGSTSNGGNFAIAIQRDLLQTTYEAPS